MDRLTGRMGTVARLLGMQSGWSYERMQGVGFGWASEPALRRLLGHDSERYRLALARATGFFNANPYLAAAALGAELRAEQEGLPAGQIERLRSALCGPLGALGDRLFWTGIVPGLTAFGVVLVTFGAGLWGVLVVVVAHNAFRVYLASWLLQLGWESGMAVGQAIQSSALPRIGSVAVRAATVLTAGAIPIVGAWLLRDAGNQDLVTVLGLFTGAVLLRWFFGRRMTATTLTLIGAVLVFTWQIVFK
jgi:mannose/fructose/N-acetylgalactosamine-specific phosphotransferase system component IID